MIAIRVNIVLQLVFHVGERETLQHFLSVLLKNLPVRKVCDTAIGAVISNREL